jgi:PAS domain S-box-containing protein
MKPAVGTAALLSEAELAAALDQLPGAVVLVDGQGQPTQMNAAARRFLGRAAGERSSMMQAAVVAGMRDARSGRLVSASTTPLARALRGETVTAEEYTFPRGNSDQDEWLKVRVSAIPLRNVDGSVRGAVATFTESAEHATAESVSRLLYAERRARAETEQALAKLELELVERKRAEEALFGSQQRLLLALEASHMGTWDYDVVNDRIEWSAEMASVVGAPLDTLRGTLAEGLTYIHPEDLPTLERKFREALENGQGVQLETRVVDESKRVRWLLVKGRVYRDEQGNPLRVTGIAMGITERKEAEAARQALGHTERLRALGQMASGIAHDLNQSLALISGYSDMARQELALDVPDHGRVREMVEITARAALEGGQALKGLLSFARTQELMVESVLIDVAEVLRDAARLTAPRWRDAPQAEGRPIHLDVQAEAGCTIHGSPSALREAFTNLIFNAVDALPRGGSIQLTVRRLENQAVVEVRDSGTGIPPDVQARMFDPFFTTKGERGTGLGLPQVVAIVERHAGRIELESEPGRGTTFRLRFPTVSAPESEPIAAADTLTTGMQASIRILVVEDEEQLARMASLVLTQRGHHVVVADSGDAGLKHLQEGRFDLVISDLGLGAGKNGWDLAQAVRGHWPNTKFVLVTGWGAGIDPQEARARGVDEVIAKPYRIADLRQIADRVASQTTSE